MLSSIAAVTLALAASAAAQVSPSTLMNLDCGGTPPPPQRSITWRVVKSPSPIPGFVRQAIYINIGVFGPATAMGCACGFAYSGTPLAGINPLGVDAIIVDDATQTQVGTLPQLSAPLASSVLTTSSLNAVQPGMSGLNWFGFSGIVNPFNPPVLPANQRFQFCFRFDIPIAIDAILKTRNGWAGGGIAQFDGTPIYDPQVEHHFEIFNPVDGRIPAPGTATLTLTGLALVARRRRA